MTIASEIEVKVLFWGRIDCSRAQGVVTSNITLTSLLLCTIYRVNLHEYYNIYIYKVVL